MEVGMYGDVFTLDYEQYGCLATDNCWFKNLWEFALHLKVTISVDKRFCLGTEREGDQSIMGFLIGGGIGSRVAVRLNQVRKFLCLVHVSKLVRADGQTLNEAVFSRAPQVS